MKQALVLFVVIVLAVVIAAAVVNGFEAASDDGSSDSGQTYQLVPCETNPGAIGC